MTLKKFLLILIALGLAACAAPTPPGPIWFQFWFALTGAPGEATIEIAQRFNAAQTRCLVELAPQDSLDDGFNKIKIGLRTKELPALVQVSNLATQPLIDLQAVAPLQDFIDRERFDLGDLEPNLLAYYTVGGKLYGMPYNTSSPIVYYNKDAFRAAGLDPHEPPRTYAQVLDYAKKLTQKRTDGKVAQYGYSMAVSGWFFEQLLAASGGLYLDHENGRAARATKAVFNSPEGVAILEWWKAGFDAGAFGNLGRATVDTQKAFDAQHVAMYVDSSAALRARVDAARGKFEIGAGFLPRPDEAAFQTSGAGSGGAAVYILKDRSGAEKNCAWDLIKFIVTPEMQADWHTASGYYPVTRQVYARQDVQAWLTRYPQFRIAVEQLRAAPNTRVTQGALTGVMPAARQRIELAIEQTLQGKATPQHALDRAAADVTKLIADYNKTVPSK